MEAFLNDLWAEARPQVITGIVGLVGVLITLLSAWVAARAASALKAIRDDKRAMSLYRTIDNVLTALIKTKLEQKADVLRGVPAGVVTDAVAMVKAQNPESVAALNQNDTMLKTKVIAKLPAVQSAVAEASAKVG